MSAPLETLDSLSSSLDEVEDMLEPLFGRSLVQIEEDLEPLQKAKLQVLLSYVIQDLVLSAFEPIMPIVFRETLLLLVYLKTKGLDPSKHPVSQELQRVKSYFDKIKDAENPATRRYSLQFICSLYLMKCIGGLVVDRAAANRFIRAAISEAQASSSLAPVGVHTRFSSINNSAEPSGSGSQNANIRRDDDDNGTSSSDSDLEVIDDVSTPAHKSGGTPPQGAVTASTNPTTSAKRRRMADPFAGMLS